MILAKAPDEYNQFSNSDVQVEDDIPFTFKQS